MSTDFEPILQAALGQDATSANPTWTELGDGRLRSFEISRGSSSDLDRNQPGTLTVVLDAFDGVLDNENSASPYFGQLVPEVPIRLLVNFDGVLYGQFAGFADSWELDYPDVADAVCVMTATDGFKVLSGQDLPRSVYDLEVDADNPVIRWRLDETQAVADSTLVALNTGTLGATGNGTFRGPPKLEEQGLIVNDPGTTMGVVDSTAAPGTTDMGVLIDVSNFSLVATGSWAVEAWVRPELSESNGATVFAADDGTGDITADLLFLNDFGGRFLGRVKNAAGTLYSADSRGHPAHGRYHVVLKHGPSRALAVYVNGVIGVTTTTTAGTLDRGDLTVGHLPGFPLDNWVGQISEFAVYTAAEASDPLTAARITAHYNAGSAPWDGDTPAARAHRIADDASWPSTTRNFETGASTLQSASFGD